MFRRVSFVAAILCSASAGAAEYRAFSHYDVTGLTLYVRFQTGASTFVATALTEGSGGGSGVYSVADATIGALAGMSVSGSYKYTVRQGSASTSAADPIFGAGDFLWSGSAELVDRPQTGDGYAAIVPKLPSNSAKIAGEGATAKNLDQVTGGGGSSFPRDLSDPQFVWKFPESRGDTARAIGTLKIVPGETILAGFDCMTGFVLPLGSRVASYTTPTGLSGELSATQVGTEGRYAKVTVAATDSAVVGTVQWVSVKMTNSFGQGPVTLTGRVLVVASHD